jgi:hypothetical protein
MKRVDVLKASVRSAAVILTGTAQTPTCPRNPRPNTSHSGIVDSTTWDGNTVGVGIGDPFSRSGGGVSITVTWSGTDLYGSQIIGGTYQNFYANNSPDTLAPDVFSLTSVPPSDDVFSWSATVTVSQGGTTMGGSGGISFLAPPGGC